MVMSALTLLTARKRIGRIVVNSMMVIVVVIVMVMVIAVEW